MAIFMKNMNLQHEVAQLDIAFLALYNILLKKGLITEIEYKAEVRVLSKKYRKKER